MPGAKTKKRPLKEQAEEARKEHLKAMQRVADLESESVAIPALLLDLPWEQGEKVALDSLSALENRRAALPHMLKQARSEEAKSELALLELQLQECEAKRPEAVQRVEDAREAFERAQTNLNAARGQHDELIYYTMSDIRRAQHVAKERLMKAEAEDITGESRGPVVHSSWQKNMASPGEENFAQDTPPSMHFGSAHVSDPPLSASEETPATVVIPEGANSKARGR